MGVKTIAEGAFSCFEDEDMTLHIKLPDGVTAISEDIFNDTFVYKIIIDIPDSVTYINNNAFMVYDKDIITIRAHAGSYAARFAKKKKLNFVAI